MQVMKMKKNIKLLFLLLVYELAAGGFQSALSAIYPSTANRLAVCAVMTGLNAILFYRLLPKRYTDSAAHYTVLGFYLFDTVLSVLPFLINVFYISEYPHWLNHFIYVPIRITAPLSESAMELFNKEKNVNVMIAVIFIVGSLNIIINLYNYILFKNGCKRTAVFC